MQSARGETVPARSQLPHLNSNSLWIKTLMVIKNTPKKNLAGYYQSKGSCCQGQVRETNYISFRVNMKIEKVIFKLKHK